LKNNKVVLCRGNGAYMKIFSKTYKTHPYLTTRRKKCEK